MIISAIILIFKQVLMFHPVTHYEPFVLNSRLTKEKATTITEDAQFGSSMSDRTAEYRMQPYFLSVQFTKETQYQIDCSF